MSIQSEITLLQNTKDELRTAIMEKGVTVEANDLFSTYPTRISQISMTPGDKDALLIGLVENSLTTFDIPVGTKELGNYALSGQRLTSVTIPNTVTVIGERNFNAAQCAITIPSSVEYIGDYAFSSPAIQSLTFEATVPPRLGLNYVFGLQTTWPIYVPEESVQAYKTAWPQQASRIKTHTIEFRKVTSMDEITSGKYLIVWENGQQSKALNSQLLLSMTMDDEYSGLNSNNSAYSVIVKEDSTIEVTDTLIDLVAADYDSENGTLSWTYGGTTYYISEFDDNFIYGNEIQMIPDIEIAPSDVTDRFTFMSENGQYIGYRATQDKFDWYRKTLTARFTNIALYKLIEN